MPESRSQADSAMSVARVRQLVRKLKADELRQPLSTLRDLRQEEQGQEIANPELLEYKKQEDAV
tara:strand:- start:135 stop:326 length:192 start_codon:yes stop_codon:yes gene_type:complete